MEDNINEQELCRVAALYDSDDDDVLCQIAAQYDESPAIQRGMHSLN